MRKNSLRKESVEAREVLNVAGQAVERNEKG